MIKKRKSIFIIVVFIFLLFTVGLSNYFYIQKIIKTPYNIKNEVRREFLIQNGQGVKEIANNLEKENFIIGKDFFEIYVYQKNVASRLQAGKYNISPSMTIPQIVNLFIKGKIIKNEILITFPEGFSVKEIDAKLTDANLISKNEFVDFDQNIDSDFLTGYEFLEDKPLKNSLQGYYFPDTYKYYNDLSVKEVAKKMLDNFNLKLTKKLREDIKKQNKTIFEIIILASIIEKEAGNTEDMGKIASVFQNRLDIGKALESDATINYIIGKNRSQATYEDLKIDSPYNTYKYKGLPPGPISNPGIEAIKAAIYPDKTDYFFFLTKKENGEAVFSETYQQHLKNKNKYLK